MRYAQRGVWRCLYPSLRVAALSLGCLGGPGNEEDIEDRWEKERGWWHVHWRGRQWVERGSRKHAAATHETRREGSKSTDGRRDTRLSVGFALGRRCTSLSVNLDARGNSRCPLEIARFWLGNESRSCDGEPESEPIEWLMRLAREERKQGAAAIVRVRVPLFLHRLVAASRLVVSRERQLSCLGVSPLEHLFVVACETRERERERERACELAPQGNWKRWETILLLVMLESSSRSAPSNQVMLMVCSRCREAWRSTIIEVSCLSPIAKTIECKYSRVMMKMARSCPSSAGEAPNWADSRIHGALRSITIMIASSWLIAKMIEYNHGH